MTTDYLALGPGATKSCLTVAELGRRMARADATRIDRNGWRTGPGQIPKDEIDPFSGSGAKLSGGRYNPPNSFATAYIPMTKKVAGAEFLRMARVGHNCPPERLLPRFVYRVQLVSDDVLDLSDPAVRDILGIGIEQLIAADKRHPQLIGEIAHRLGFEVIVAPSVTNEGNVAVVLGAPAVRNLSGKQSDAWFTLSQVPTWTADPSRAAGIA